MKTRDLIARLQAADPSGEAECVCDGDDVYTVSRVPMYYDGRPTLLVHDPALLGKCFSVVGLRVPAGGDKVKIQTMSVEALMFDKPDVVVDNDILRSRYEPGIEETRAEVRAMLAEPTVAPPPTPPPARGPA